MEQPDLNNIFLSKIYSKLIECALSSETVTTEQLLIFAGLPKTNPKTVQKAMNGFLTRIANFEHKCKRPMLTSLVVQKSKKPTKAWLKSFFINHLGHPEEFAEEESKKLLSPEYSKNCLAILKAQQQIVLDYWTVPKL